MTTTDTKTEPITLLWNHDTQELRDEENNLCILGVWNETYGGYRDVYDWRSEVYDKDSMENEVESAVEAKSDELTNDMKVALEDQQADYQARLLDLVDALDVGSLPAKARAIAEAVQAERRFAYQG